MTPDRLEKDTGWIPFAHNDPLAQRSAKAKTDVEKQCESTDQICSKRTVRLVALGSDAFRIYP